MMTSPSSTLTRRKMSQLRKTVSLLKAMTNLSRRRPKLLTTMMTMKTTKPSLKTRSLISTISKMRKNSKGKGLRHLDFYAIRLSCNYLSNKELARFSAQLILAYLWGQSCILQNGDTMIYDVLIPSLQCPHIKRLKLMAFVATIGIVKMKRTTNLSTSRKPTKNLPAHRQLHPRQKQSTSQKFRHTW